jgi:hypothetical protein
MFFRKNILPLSSGFKSKPSKQASNQSEFEIIISQNFNNGSSSECVFS